MAQPVNKDHKTGPVSLAQLEHAIVNENFSEAEAIFSGLIDLQLLSRLEFIPKSREEVLSPEQSIYENIQVIERLVVLLTMLMSNTSYQVSAAMYAKLTLNKKFISNLFSASSYRNTGHIIKHLGVEQKSNHSRGDILKLLALVTPESEFVLPWAQLLKFMPDETLRAYMGLMFCSEFNISKLSTTQLNGWAGMAKTLPMLSFNTASSMTPIASAYFNMSSLTGDGKYEFKKWAVKSFENYMDKCLSAPLKESLANSLVNRKSVTKKTILIIHDHYRKGHAMHRCYSHLIRGLREGYNVIGLSQIGFVDDLGKSDHDDYLEYPDYENLEEIVSDIVDIAPDIILYPSIGMGQLALFLASIRLAPIQCLCPGHPSSSYFPNIDYMLLEDLGIKRENLDKILTEKAIVLDSKQVKLVPLDFELNQSKKYEGKFNIAINGVITKVTHELIDVCKQINEKTKKEINYHFFMSSPKHDIEYYAALSVLRRELPNAVLHTYSDYNTYMNNLVVCDFALPTLPFGGANSNVDLVRLGIPKLFVLDESDLPGSTDYYMWREFGELSGFCKSADEIVEKAVNLLSDPKMLEALKRKVEEIDITRFFDTGEDTEDDRLLRSVNQFFQ